MVHVSVLKYDLRVSDEKLNMFQINHILFIQSPAYVPTGDDPAKDQYCLSLIFHYVI